MLNFLFTKTPLVFLVQPFWRDEAFSYLLSKKNLWDILILTAKDNNPPLYYFIMHFWLIIFGKSEVAMRSLSFIFYWCTIYLVYLILVEIFNFTSKKSFFYLLFVAINPFLIYYAFEARMYSMFAFLATLSFYAFLKKKWRLYILSIILGLFTHYFMLFVLLTQIILITKLKLKKSEKKTLIYKLYAIPSLIFLPWSLYILSKMSFFSGDFWIDKIDIVTILSMPAVLYTGFEKSFLSDPFLFNFNSILIMFFGFFIFVILALGLEKAKKFNHHLITTLLYWTFLTPSLIVLFSLVKPLWLPRYFIFTNIGMILLLIIALECFKKSWKICLLTFLIISTLMYHELQIKVRQKSDLRKPIEEIEKLMGKNDRLFVDSELDFHVAEYYLNEKDVYVYGKSYEEIPSYVGKILIPKNKVVTALPIYPAKAFILKSDGTYNIQAIF